MNNPEKQMIMDIANIFRNNRDVILQNWIDLIKDERLIENNEVLYYFKKGFETVVDDFINYLSVGDFEGYYEGNSIISRDIAYNDVSFEQFIDAFHLFEESYSGILSDSIDRDRLLDYMGVIDRLHHKTISIVARQYFDVKDATVFALATMAELKDTDTANHLNRTREYSVLLAEDMGCDRNFINNLYRVGPLHDIGKVGIKDSILLKPGRLTRDEYEEMKTHVIVGANTIEKIIDGQRVSRGYLLMARDIIKYHHEKYNGSGYPEGLIGDEIPLAARIFALADAYDAIVSKRPYKEAMTHSEAVRRISRASGTHFDPRVVRAFMENENKIKGIYDSYKEKFSIA